MARFGGFEEIQAWQKAYLHIALGLGYVKKQEFDSLYGSLAEVSRMTLSLAKYLRDTHA